LRLLSPDTAPSVVRRPTLYFPVEPRAPSLEFLISFKRRNVDFTMMVVQTRWTNDEDGIRAGEVSLLGS
jgi:hypothetical protein